MAQQGTTDDAMTLAPWEPGRHVRSVDAAEVRYSRGFLRCRPEKWFPAFATHWLPLAHSLGVELKAIEVKPALGSAAEGEIAFGGSVDGEGIGIFLDPLASRILLNAVLPGASPQGADVTLEYLARRLLASLAMSWSGPESSVLRFDPNSVPAPLDRAGAVKLTAAINGNPFVIWLAFGKGMVERLDGLWRRQVVSSAKAVEAGPVAIELSQLAVPPTMLVDYLKSGTVIDLEVPVSDQVTLRLGNRAWQLARLCSVQGRVGVEVQGGPPPAPILPEGTTRLSIQFGSLNLDASALAELSQAGAIWVGDLPLQDTVQLVINNERVGSANLCCYQGRFAITVA